MASFFFDLLTERLCFAPMGTCSPTVFFYFYLTNLLGVWLGVPFSDRLNFTEMLSIPRVILHDRPWDKGLIDGALQHLGIES
jgi:hypothetical protein